ncbi:2-oxoglutarate-dependent dioxygenase 11-like [Panicum virgatum]|uniref:2-oxoglutarate-dependent dioxygenase 11-like n=1 Tax=Panicum virgatum TaxID=38727 RepID=UPI0019D694B2|nr:2-oxoglutarate-dependent dioxygenase 11-like [Panicum virgatum]
MSTLISESHRNKNMEGNEIISIVGSPSVAGGSRGLVVLAVSLAARQQGGGRLVVSADLLPGKGGLLAVDSRRRWLSLSSAPYLYELRERRRAEAVRPEVLAGIGRPAYAGTGKEYLYAQLPGDLQGYGLSFVVSERQTLDWSDMFVIIAHPPEARDLRYWPVQPHTFRSELMKTAHSIVTVIAKTLDIDLELMVDKYVCQYLRMNYYPPCMTMAKKVLGFSPHSDGSFLTFLLEVNSVEGLQIKRHNAWIPVKPNPNALLVNVGDFLEIMSNGKYKSIEHRVTINTNQERLTLSAFHVPSLDGVVSPVTDIAEERPLYKAVGVEEYSKLYMSNKLDGKRALDHAKLL